MNFAAQAARDIRKWADAVEGMGFSKDAFLTRATCDLIEQAEHFELPDGGCLCDGATKALIGLPLRLPFPVITLAYRLDAPFVSPQPGVTVMRDRLLLATEVDMRDLRTLRSTWPDGLAALGLEIPEDSLWDGYGIAMRPAFRPHGVNNWMICPCGLEFGRDVLHDSRELTGVSPTIGLPQLATHGGVTFTELAEAGKGVLTEELFVLLGFLGALACVNVSTEVAQEASPANRRRVAAGKLPIWETKRLVITAPRDPSTPHGPDKHTGIHPRQHLRRGHIRRLEKGPVWVNACIVGRTHDGTVAKEYVVKARRGAAEAI